MHRCALLEGARGWLSDLPCSGDKSLRRSALRTEAAGRAGGGRRAECGASGEDGAPDPRPRRVSDVNECRRYPGRLCGHKCENTPGSYFCSCTAGFRLSTDGRSCEGEGRRRGGLLGTDPRSFPRHTSNDVGEGPACERLRVRDGCSPISPGSSGARQHLPILVAEGAAWDHG